MPRAGEIVTVARRLSLVFGSGSRTLGITPLFAQFSRYAGKSFASVRIANTLREAWHHASRQLYFASSFAGSDSFLRQLRGSA